MSQREKEQVEGEPSAKTPETYEEIRIRPGNLDRKIQEDYISELHGDVRKGQKPPKPKI